MSGSLKTLLLILLWVGTGVFLLSWMVGKPFEVYYYILVTGHTLLPVIVYTRRQRRQTRRLKDVLSEYAFSLQCLQDEAVGFREMANGVEKLFAEVEKLNGLGEEINNLRHLSDEVSKLRRLRKPAGEFDRLNPNLTAVIGGEIDPQFAVCEPGIKLASKFHS